MRKISTPSPLYRTKCFITRLLGALDKEGAKGYNNSKKTKRRAKNENYKLYREGKYKFLKAKA